MTPEEQKAGEARVRRVLVDPLLRRGLAKPSALTKAAFDEMLDDLCERLAYMSEGGLAALEEQVAANPGGKDRDRLPIANTVLKWAGDIEPPPDDASPLLRAVFAHQIGRDAIDQGWGPELLADVRRTRRFPKYVVTIREAAAEPLRRLALIEDRLRRGEDVSAEDARFRAVRLARIEKCRAIAALSEGAE